MTGDINGTAEKYLGRFGIGCLQFRPKDIDTDYQNFQTYKSRLERALAQIAAIQDFSIETNDNLGAFENQFPTPFASLSDSEYPDLASSSGLFLEITLKLRIPERAQRDLLEEHDTGWRPFKEIVVYLTYGYSMPLMMVYLSKANDGDATPSDCVRLVRDFLMTEMTNNANCEFTADTLGPTPFHADFSLLETNQVTNSIAWSRTDNRAYDLIEIKIPTGLKEFRDMVWHLDEHLLDDLDVFYSITLERSKVMDAWYDCFSEIKDFEEKFRASSKLGRLFSHLFPGLSIHDLISQIAEFRFINTNAHETTNERIRSNVFLKIGPIWKDIRILKKTFPQYDIDSLEKLVEFIDKKQTHRQSIANTIFAAIAGGVAGALVAFLPHTLNHSNHAQTSAPTQQTSMARSQQIAHTPKTAP